MNHNAATVALVNRLKFKHLALLVALDDARNVHQAAEAINVAQPSASRMLGDIEEAFGFLLFEPLGLAKIYDNLRNYFLVWPFRHARR